MKDQTPNNTQDQNAEQKRNQVDPKNKENSGRFEKGTDRARESGRKGGRNS
jgi:hypothetical protein